LVQIFRILWARRLILVVAILACMVTAVGIGKIMPARFKANSRVMLDIVKPDPVTGTTLASSFVRAYVKTQTELIRDYRVAGRAADILGWTSSPQLAAEYRRRPESDTRDFRRWVSQKIIDGTDAQLIEASNILEISYVTSNPETAAKVADAVREAYVDQSLDFKREDATKNAEWFRNQTARIRDELTQAEKRKSDFERANGIVLDADNVDQASKRLSALAASAQPAAAAAVMMGPNPAAAQLAQIDAAIASAEKVLGPNHPDLLQMRRQRAAVASSAAASRPTMGGGGGPSIESMYNAQVAKVLAQRGKVEEARQLGMDVAVLRDQYQRTAARAADLQQQGEASESGLTLLGNAVAPPDPIFPKWPLLILGSFGLGAALGILAALLVELLGRRVRGIEDLKHEKVPVLGMMTVSEAAPPRAGIIGRFWPRRAKTGFA
jgi:uncharacterized protein involved in exopolysaccharide biosynthesis